MLKVFKCLRIDLVDNCFHLVEHLVDARLHVCEVVLDLINQLTQTPEHIGLC